MTPTIDVIDRNMCKRTLPAIQYREAKIEDAENIVRFCREHPEVAFCDWQDVEVTRRVLSRSTTFAFIASQEQQIIGVIIGGALGSRGTINHLAITPKFRSIGVGTSLTAICLRKMKSHGIQRVFLFIADSNDTATVFWGNYGFREITEERTLECDL